MHRCPTYTYKIYSITRQQLYNKDNKDSSIKDLQLVPPKFYTFMFSNIFFIALCMPGNYLEKTANSKSPLPPSTCETSLDTSLSQNSLSVHCKQTNSVKNKVDGQLLLIDLVFLEIGTHHCHLVFKLSDENNNVITPKIFFPQFLNKDNKHI